MTGAGGQGQGHLGGGGLAALHHHGAGGCFRNYSMKNRNDSSMKNDSSMNAEGAPSGVSQHYITTELELRCAPSGWGLGGGDRKEEGEQEREREREKGGGRDAGWRGLGTVRM